MEIRVFFHTSWDQFVRFPQNVPDSDECRPPTHLALGEPLHIRRAYVTDFAFNSPQMSWTLTWFHQRTVSGDRKTNVKVSVQADRLKIECFTSILSDARKKLQGRHRTQNNITFDVTWLT